MVVGHGAEAVGVAARAIEPEAIVAVQERQLGTGHAVLAAREALGGFDGDLFVLFGDTPFLRPETLERIDEDIKCEPTGITDALGFYRRASNADRRSAALAVIRWTF